MAFGLLYNFLIGQEHQAFNFFGAHFINKDGVHGVVFRLYAPCADDVSVVGDWNNFQPGIDKMEKIDDCGAWEVFIPNLDQYMCYKYHFKNAKGEYVDKCDPFAFFSELRPSTASKLFDIENFIWHDLNWMKKRTRNFDNPVSIYELHLGSWKGQIEDRWMSYEEIADELIPYLDEMGYTHVEIMPITQYPFDGSWGYQATGFFSADSRYGNPFQFMSFVDRLHNAGYGVILDFAPAHFATDPWALIEYDGTHLFEYTDPKYTYSPWGSCYFDLSKNPVRSFLISAVNYYCTYFHIDGVRVDAVSNILYWNGNKNLGENSGAIEFLKRLNYYIHYQHHSVMMIAEDSSDYQGVTKPLDQNGLGFDYKWDLGWMNDTLGYYGLDPIYKKYEHNKLTFSMAYFYSENFMLPLSHDEVVHGKGTIINKMYGEYDTKFDLLRNLYVYQYTHPGKKLNFMGNELASFDEWDEKKSIPWCMKDFPKHVGVQNLIKDLNKIYTSNKALYEGEYDWRNFQWLMVDNNDQSVFVYQRKINRNIIVTVMNMTPNSYDIYDIPMENPGYYREILNTNDLKYEGNGLTHNNGLLETSDKVGPEGHPYSMSIKLPGYSAIIFKREKAKPKKYPNKHKNKK